MAERSMRSGFALVALAGACVAGCVEHPGAETRESGSAAGGATAATESGAGGATEAAASGGAGGQDVDCPTHATECPPECFSIAVTPLIYAAHSQCLGPLEVVGCYSRAEIGFDKPSCSISADGTYAAVGGPSLIDTYLGRDHGYRSCEAAEYEYYLGLWSCP